MKQDAFDLDDDTVTLFDNLLADISNNDELKKAVSKAQFLHELKGDPRESGPLRQLMDKVYELEYSLKDIQLMYIKLQQQLNELTNNREKK